MQLKPKLPPGRASRKALRYVSEVHRLRAEGHTFESIRLALLDAGVTVSVSTVRREAARPPSKRELAHARAMPPALEESQSGAAAMSVTAPTPASLDAGSGQTDGPGNGEPALPQIEALDDRRRVGLLSIVFAVLRRLGRARWLQ